MKHGAIEFSSVMANLYSNLMNGTKVNKKPLITFFCIATNGYTEYAENLLASIDKLSSPEEVQVILVSDKELSSCDFQNLILTNVKIGSLAWPWATLMRYHLITKHIDLSISENVCYIDADSIVHEPFWKAVDFETATNGLIFVRHPGYFRGSPAADYFEKTINLIRDLKMYILEGGLGNWEKRRKSKAYVNRLHRDVYICGGVWMGKMNSIKEMSLILQGNVDLDLSRNIIARWHDESHLNNYFVKNKSNLVGPEFCFAKNRPNLKGISMIIEAVDK